MNVLNEKIRILQTQIDSEKKKEKPNLKNIKNLEKELKYCIEGMGGFY